MKPKQAHIILFCADFFVFFIMWIAYHEFQNVLAAINNGADVIKFQGRTGLATLGFFMPIAHAIIIFERLFPKISKKYGRGVNLGVIIASIALFVVGIGLSAWIKNQVEGAGYTYCYKASRVSVVTQSLVYTKDMDTCEALIQQKKDKNLGNP